MIFDDINLSRAKIDYIRNKWHWEELMENLISTEG